jgi:hypothetical protein
MTPNELELEEAKNRTVKLDDDQLLCLMTAIMLSGTFTFRDPVKNHYCSMRIAEQIYDRIVRNREYTEWDDFEDEFRAKQPSE